MTSQVTAGWQFGHQNKVRAAIVSLCTGVPQRWQCSRL